MPKRVSKRGGKKSSSRPSSPEKRNKVLEVESTVDDTVSYKAEEVDESSHQYKKEAEKSSVAGSDEAVEPNNKVKVTETEEAEESNNKAKVAESEEAEESNNKATVAEIEETEESKKKDSVAESEEEVDSKNIVAPSAGSKKRDTAVKKKPLSSSRKDQWKKKFEELLVHQKKHGNLIPPRQTSLSNWVSMQRRLKRKNELQPELVSQLEKIGFQWDGRVVTRPKADETGKRRQEQWENFFEEYKKFKELNGRPPKARTPLYYWAVRQGQMHKKGSLSEDQIQKLKSIGLCSK